MKFYRYAIAGFYLLLDVLLANAQVQITAGQTVVQPFDIGTSPTATLPTGWKVDKNSNDVRKVGVYSNASTSTEREGGANMSNTASNGIYNFGNGTDRAVGGLSSGSASKSVNLYTQLTNNGTSRIEGFTISYAVEKYRKGSNPAGFAIQMYYSRNGTDWISAGDDFLTTFTADAENAGFATVPGETKIVSDKTLFQALAAGESIYFAWNYSVASGTTTSNAQALGIDDVSIKALSEIPVVVEAPSVSASALVASNIQGRQTELSWTNGNGTNRLVLMRKGTSIDFLPVANTTYVANQIFGAGTDLGGGTYAIFNGSSNSVIVGGLDTNTVYVAAVFEYNGPQGLEKYLTSSPATATFTTTGPSVAVDFEAGTFGDWVAHSAASPTRNWAVMTGTGANNTNRFAEMNGYISASDTTSADDWLISPLVDLSANQNVALEFFAQYGFTDDIVGLSVYYSTNYRADFASSTWTILTEISLPSTENAWTPYSVDLSGLQTATPVSLAFRYQSTGGGSNKTRRWRIDEIKLVAAKPIETPTIAASALTASQFTANTALLAWTRGNGTRSLVIGKESGAVDTFPVDGQTYNTQEVFGSGTDLGNGNFALYSGTASEVRIFGLKPATTYHFAVFEFNGTAANTKFLTTDAPVASGTTTEVTIVTGPKAEDLFFSEYIEGSSNNKALEIFNGTGTEVDLSNYRINGKNNASDPITVFTWPTGTILPHGATRVIVDGSASEQLKALAHDITPVIPQGSSVRYVTSFNGNDWRTLEKRSGTTWSVIDQIGESENTPSVAWDVAGVGGATVDRTLVRKPYVTKGNTNWSASAGTTPENSEWEIRNLDDFSDLRKHTFDPSALVDPFDFTAVALNRTTIKLSWRLNGAGHNILLVISTDDQFAVPANGTAYAVDDLIGDDKVIAKGSLTTITLQNLVAGQEYFFKIYSFNDLNEYSPGKVVRVAPVKPEPSNHVTNFRVTSFTGSSLSFGWTDDTGAVTADGFLVAISADGATSVFVPTDGTEPANNNFIRKVNRGVQAVTFNFLSNNVTYTAKIYPFTNRGALIDFKTDGSIPVAQGVTDGASLFENIGGELKGAELISLLRNDYRVTRSLGYDTARERMYISIDVNSNDSLLCVYTGYGIKINRSGGGRSQANAGNINAEHTWPQSLGARNEPMRSDLHHIFPTWANVNSARGNLPFAAIPDNQVSSWWGIGTVGGLKTAPPIDVRYKFSKLRDNTAFEPRADHRGNVARAIFYFWMRWQNDATVSANQRFFEGMKETLYRWHYLDLPDEREVKRSNDIAAEQGNRNPFVHDTTLIRRAFFPHIGGGGGNTFTVTSSAVQFNTRRIGASDTLFVFVQNNSGSTSLSLTNIRIEGDAAFSTTASLLSIASGRTGAIPVVFKPTAKAGYTAQLKFSNSFNTNETVLEITGRGGEFAVTYRPSRVRFNLDDVQDVYRTFSVVNTGETVFTLDNVAPNSRFYSYGVFFTQAEFPVIMMPGDSVRFELELDFTSFSSQNVDTIFVMIDGAKQPYALIDATSAVSVSEDMVPKKLALHQNYPNPFNPSTRISFDITSAQFVTLEVFSITGQRVGVLVNNTLSAGRHMVTFDATGLASGLYLYRLTTPSGTLTRKLMLMK